MILLLFALITLSFGVVSLYSSTTYQAYISTFNGINYGLSDTWIVYNIKESDDLYYDTNLVESSTIDYFKSNLKHYIDSFKVGFYYFDSENLDELQERYVTGVRVSLRADIPFQKEFYKAETFLIKRNK